MGYGYQTTITGAKLPDAVAAVTEALKAEGFGVLTEIDVKATLKKKIDVDFRPYVILGACNPRLAHQALELDDQMGLLLPCNVVVQEVADGAKVSIVDPHAMFQVVHDERVQPIASDAAERLQRVIAALQG